MFVRCLASIRKSAPLAVGAALLLLGGNSGLYAEPIEFSKSEQKPDATQDKKNNILNYRAYRPSQSVSGSSGVNDRLSAPAVPAPVAPSTRTTRQQQDLLDRQKNWIFVTPENEKKADSAEEVLGIDENALDGQSKSIVTQFLENKKSNDSKAGEANEWDKDQKKQFGKEKNFGLGNERQNRNDGSLQPNSEEKNFGGPREELSLPQLWRDQHSPRAEKMREEKQVRMNEFQGLFKSQSVAPVPQGFNAQNNLNLQSGGSPSGSGVSFNRSAPTPYNSVKNPPRAPAGVSPLGLPNINTRVFGQSAAPIAAPEPVRSASQPAVLPLPKRRL